MKGSESLGFGIIEYKTDEEAQKSKVKLDNHMILDQQIRLTYCIPGKSGIFLCTRIITKFVSFAKNWYSFWLLYTKIILMVYIFLSFHRAPTTLKSEGEVTSLSGADKREVRDNSEKWWEYREKSK